MRHEFHKKCTADHRFDVVWVDEVCLHCGKNRELCKEKEECPVRGGIGASIVGKEK
jgi:hypothetical protein